MCRPYESAVHNPCLRTRPLMLQVIVEVGHPEPGWSAALGPGERTLRHDRVLVWPCLSRSQVVINPREKKIAGYFRTSVVS